MAKTCYKVSKPLGLQYRQSGKKAIQTVTPESGVFDPKELGVPADKIKQWLKEDRIEKVMVEDSGKVVQTAAKTGATGSKRKKPIWTFNEEDLAEMSIEDLNMKIQQVCSTEKVPKKDRPATFENPVDAIEFLTQEN